METLKRAATETFRQLGVNILTLVTVIVGFGLTIIIVRNLSTPETDSVTDVVLWFAKSIAWLLSVIVIFIPLVALNTFKVVRQYRSANANLRMIAATAASVDNRMKSFLRISLSDPWYGVVKCYAFGSVVRQDPTRDVDIIIQFKSSKQNHVRTFRVRMRKIENLFKEFHGLQLHVQTFLSTEDEALQRFLNNTGAHERII